MENMSSVEPQMMPASMASDQARATFLKNTYLHLAFSILAFIVVEFIFLNVPVITSFALSLTQGWYWLAMLGGFMLVTSFAESWAMSSSSKAMQYVALMIYVAAQAFIFIPLMFIAIGITGDVSLISQAGVLTACLFTALTAIAFFSGADFSFLRTGLIVGGIVAFGLIVAGIAFGFSLGLWFSGAMVLLAAGSILYQTSQMIHVYRTDQYVAASLGLFASFMLMLWYILRILIAISSD